MNNKKTYMAWGEYVSSSQSSSKNNDEEDNICFMDDLESTEIKVSNLDFVDESNYDQILDVFN